MDSWIARAIDHRLDRAGPWLAAVLLALILWIATGASLAKPLWHDEIYTWLLARLPASSTIWSAHRDGVDLQPPLNTMATRAAHRLFGSGVTATRLPALAGFSLMTGAVFGMLRRRAGTTLALAGALIPVQTAAFRYSYEARGYGLMLGCVALALFAWTEAVRGSRRRWWIPVCAVALAAGVWAHYYAAVAFVAIGIGECVRWIRQRRVDVHMMGGFVAGGLMTLPLVPLARVAFEQAPNFWTTAAPEEATSVYRFLLAPLEPLLWGPGGAAVVLALAFTAVSAAIARSRGMRPEALYPIRHWRVFPAHEAAALVCLLLAPAAMLFAARLTGGAFTPRYGLVAVVAVAIGLPLIVRLLAPRGSLAEVVLLAVFAIPLVTSAVHSYPRPAAADPIAARPLLAAALKGPGPLVASGGLSYLQLWFYAPPLERGRLVYLADPARALAATGSDTIDRGYVNLARWTAVPVRPYTDFIEQHREFSVYASGSGWLLDALEADGAALERLGAEPGGRAFRVVR